MRSRSLAWLGTGTKDDVGGLLRIAPATVRTHLQRVRAKYAAAGRLASTKSALLARAVEDGLIGLADLDRPDRRSCGRAAPPRAAAAPHWFWLHPREKPETVSVADVEARRMARKRPPRCRPRSDFRPDIEGLRAVAVLAVVAFHAGAIGGGFIGVDVFFVISGFLITRMLWADRSATGRVQLARFYGARARRLLPAAATVLVVTAVATTVLLPPCRRARRSTTAWPARSTSATTAWPSPGPTTWPTAPLAVPALLVTGRGGAVLPAVAGIAARRRVAMEPPEGPAVPCPTCWCWAWFSPRR